MREVLAQRFDAGKKDSTSCGDLPMLNLTQMRMNDYCGGRLIVRQWLMMCCFIVPQTRMVRGMNMVSSKSKYHWLKKLFGVGMASLSSTALGDADTFTFDTFISDDGSLRVSMPPREHDFSENLPHEVMKVPVFKNDQKLESSFSLPQEADLWSDRADLSLSQEEYERSRQVFQKILARTSSQVQEESQESRMREVDLSREGLIVKVRYEEPLVVQANPQWKEPLKPLTKVLATPSRSSQDQLSYIRLSGMLLPLEGVDFSQVKIRLAGTSFDIVPQSDGRFDLPPLPQGSKVELIVWDAAGRLARKLIPINISSQNKNLKISLSSMAPIYELAQTFGVNQDMMKAGFCATIKTKFPLEGARVEVSTSRGNLQPYYWSKMMLPSRETSSLSSAGKFCVFNVEEKLVNIAVTLPNGHRRNFVKHLESTLFDDSYIFEMDKTLYRSTSFYELVDEKDDAFAKQNGYSLYYSDSKSYDWLVVKNDKPVWGNVSEVFVKTDALYAGSYWKNKNASVYFPLGDAFETISWGDSQGNETMFSLMSQESLNQKNISLYGVSLSFLKHFEYQYQLSRDYQKGGVFMDIPLKKWGIQAHDVKFAVRDSWTNERVGEYFVEPLQDGETLRIYVYNLPEGQFSLSMRRQSSEAILWHDIVRSVAGKTQVISLQ